jgi:beta-N-acetylhexosaminidase
LLSGFLCFGAAAAEPSLQQMAGQMIFVGFQGDSASSTKKLAAMIGEGRVGGVMYLRTNIKSLDAVKEMNAQFERANRLLPPFIALDQEGGKIERLTKAVGFKEIPSAADIAKNGDIKGAEAIYAKMARSVSDLGFNVNFGPVADLNINKSNPIIARYGRSYGADVEDVVGYSTAFVHAHRKAKVLTALKHFPGHGSSTADSHEGFVDISQTWRQKELEPYRQMVSAESVDMVMVGHLYHSGYAKGESGRIPSSLSANWITKVLRQDLGYLGVVITDDLEMGAIRAHFSLKETVVAAVRAGVDILLFSNTADYRFGLPDEISAILLAEAQKDPQFEKRIRESYGRIVALKNQL